MGNFSVTHEDIDKVAFTGSTAVGRRIILPDRVRNPTEPGGKSPYLLFDDADLGQCGVELVDAIWFNRTSLSWR